MSFIDKVRKEIIQSENQNTCCEIALLSGAVKAGGSVVKTSSELGLEIPFSDFDSAKFVSSLVVKLFAEGLSLVEKQDKLNKTKKYHLHLESPRLFEILAELGIMRHGGREMSFNTGIPIDILQDTCCKANYIKGMILATGKMVEPAHGKPYLFELYLSGEKYAESVVLLLAEFDIAAKVITRGNFSVVYIKNSQAVSDFLILAGAQKSMLELSGFIVNKSASNKSNRVSNFEIANISKTAAAAAKQIIAINAIGFENLEPKLKAVAKLRLENNEAALYELSVKSNLTKSCIKHRLDKILSIHKRGTVKHGK